MNPRRRWLILRGLPLLALLGASFVNLYALWVANAPSTPDPRGDAVVVHAGQGDRFGHGFDLMDEGAAPTLVLMFAQGNRSVNRFCGRDEPYEIICPTPELATTIGESRELAMLVEERGWTTVVTVTSDYHLRRATYLNGKCSGIDIVGSGSGQAASRAEIVPRIAEEMAAMVQAVLVRC